MDKQKNIRFIVVLLIFSSLLQLFSAFLVALDIKALEFVHEIHAFNGIVLVLLITAHAVLNWDWIKFNLFRGDGRA